MGSGEIQGALWNSAARNWCELQEPLQKPQWEAIFDEVNLNSNSNFLDAGCGGGGACLLAERRGAKITGIEAAPAMVEFAQKQVLSGTFTVGDIQELPYTDSIFDVVLASSSLQYTEDKRETLRELKRVTRRNGLVAVSLWSKPEKVEYRIIFEAVKKLLPSPPAGKGPFELSGDNVLENLMESVGLDIIVSKDVHCPFKYKDFEIFWKVNISTGPIQMALKAISEETLKKELRKVIGSKQADDGTIYIDNYFKYVVGKNL